MFKKLKKLIMPEASLEVRTEITQENTRSVKTISATVFILEAIVLSLFLLTSENPFGKTEIKSVISVVICMIVSAIVWIYMRLMDKSGKSAVELRNQENHVLGIYFVVLANWGMAASLRHYVVGEQMLTFFIVELIFASFIAINPMLAILLVPGSFAEFYWLLYRVDHAAGLNVINYGAMALLCYIAVTIKYQRTVRQIESSRSIRNLNVQLAGAAATDTLTELGNRLAVRNRVSEVVGKEVGVMLADVDLFKEFNDNSGHDAGDEVLVKIAQELKKAFPVEACFRYGGDEFLVITEGMSKNEFIARKEHWQREIRKICITNVCIPVQCSCGMAFGTPEVEVDIRNLIHDADQALYEEKREHHFAAI